MGKTSKWIKNFLTGKKEKEKEKEKEKDKKEKDREEKEKDNGNQSNSFSSENPTTPILIRPTTLKEKRRWSFRRSAVGNATPKHSNSTDSSSVTPPLTRAVLDSENDHKKHAIAMAETKAESAMIRLTTVTNRIPTTIEEASAIKIQAIFRSYLARKALCALKGLVKLQALVRGHLVRKQATATLRCMEALVTVQARARAQRIRMVEEPQPVTRRQSIHRQSPQNDRFRQAYNEMAGGIEDNIKIVEMDLGTLNGNCRNSYSNHQYMERVDPRFSTYYGGDQAHFKHEHQISPAPSALTEMSPKAYSAHFEEYSLNTTQSSPQFYSNLSKPDPTKAPFAFPRTGDADSISHDYTFFPNYMAYTHSSRAKVRSQSAPKQRPDSFERQPSRRRPSIEGRNIPRNVKMQRSSSHVGSTSHGYQYPWSIKLDRSSMSLKDSESGSTSTVLTNINYCKSLVAYQPHGSRY